MNATFTSLHGMMQLPPMDARITPPPEELNVVIPKLQTFPVLPLSPASLPDTPHPDTSSVSNSSPRKKQRRRSSGSRNRTSKADTKQQAQVNSSLLFSPRPFESLYIERAYLATSLQQQAGRAAELMRQYCAVELQLQSLAGDNGRRKLRKQLSLLKSRVNQAAEQEKVIFSRLGELYVEIQSRETWAQAWSVDSSSVSTPLYFSPVSCSFPTPTSPLGGASADFTPMGYFSDFHQVTEPAYFHQEPVMYGLETVDEAGEDLLYNPASSGKSVESETIPATPLTADVPSVEEKNECVLETEKNPIDGRCMAVRERRLSLPCLYNAWL
ncbi:Ff.00g081270.m01.CDS01 [Fusarium sp. VM40]|nr:Ff.00g081270.m01.CDS01 [Fusarium sp. VM40]